MKSKLDFIDRLPVLKSHPKLARLTKFALSAFLIYFICKTPMIWLLTEYGHLHYVLSGAIAGSVVSLLNFVPAEFWIWRKKS